LPVPWGLIGGNRLNKTIGSSTFGGGRMQVCASGVGDENTGMLTVRSTPEKVLQTSDNMPGSSTAAVGGSYNNQDAGNKKRSIFDTPPSMMKKLLHVPNHNYIQTELIPVELAKTCPGYLWEMFLMRRLPFLFRVLHLDYKESDYHILANVGNVLKNLNFAIRGLDRSYLRIDQDSMGRNLGGPLRTCLMQGIFQSQIIQWSTRRMLRFSTSDNKSVGIKSVLKEMDNQNPPDIPSTSANADVDMPDREHGPAVNDTISVDFMKSVKNMVASMLYVPLTISTILAACHLWLLTNVLDISCMVLVCFFAYITGLEEHCPLHVLALVARNQKLSVKQKRLYVKFCHHIAPVVLSKSFSSARVPKIKKVNAATL
ncbi:MAG: hypothetical protein EBR93_06415, partial [Bacteroidetes bacterium]|nr:hypothetical protein [Bacteroidota bacterium]